MSDYKISVIIPAHNSAGTIERCIEAVLAQKTGSGFEIIIVENGSEDQTLEKCESYSRRNENVRIISLERMSPGRARNIGLQQSRGDYIWFVDSDDYPKENMLSSMIVGIDGVQQVICGFDAVNNASVEYKSAYLDDGRYSLNDLLLDVVKTDTNIYYGAVWNKLYDARIIREHDIAFDEDTSMAEDLLFNIKYWQYTDYIYAIKDSLYQYDISPKDSLSVVKRDIDNYWVNEKRLFISLRKLLIDKDLNSLQVQAYMSRYGWYLRRRAIFGILGRYPEIPLNKKKNRIERILSDEDIETISKKYFRITEWITYMLWRIGMSKMLIRIMENNIRRKRVV